MGLLGWARRVIGAEPTPATKQELEDRRTTWRTVDFFGAAVANITPAKYAAALRSANAGNITTLVQYLRALGEKDLHLQGVLGTRKQAVVGVARQIVPALPDDPEAQQIADWVDEQMRGLPDFERVLLELLDGIYQPLAAQEIMWTIEGGKAVPTDLVWVDPARLRYVTSSYVSSGDVELGELRLLVAPGDSAGERLLADKYVIHRPPQKAGYPWQQGLGRGLGWISVFGLHGLKWFATSVERDAMPFRSARADGSVGETDRKAIEQGLASLGAQGWALFPEGVLDFEIHQPQLKPAIFNDYLARLDAMKSKAVLGHVGSADSTPGKLGSEEQAGDVRQDLLEADAQALANTVRRDLFGPLVRMNFDEDAPVPFLRFDVEIAEDLDGLATRVKTLSEAGLAIPSSWAYERFAIPAPTAGEDILEASPASPGLPFV